MKRLSTISFSIIYLLLTAGFTMNIHYCLGEIESVSIIPIADDCCCGDGLIVRELDRARRPSAEPLSNRACRRLQILARSTSQARGNEIHPKVSRQYVDYGD